MKNKIQSLLGAVVLFVAMIALAFSAPAQSFYNSDFLSGQDMIVVGTATNKFAQTNIYVKYGSDWGPGYTTNGTPQNWVTNAGAIQDVPLYADRDGTAPSDAAISAHIYTTNTLATNTITFRFAGVPRAPSVSGTPGLAATAAQNLWQFSLVSNGTNDVVISTNFPTANFQGCYGIRLLGVESASANGTTNIVLRSLRLNGFRP